MLAPVGLHLVGLSGFEAAALDRWRAGPPAAATLLVSAGFRVTFLPRQSGRRPMMARTRLEVQPEGVGFMEAWLLALRDRGGAQQLVEETAARFGQPEVVTVSV